MQRRAKSTPPHSSHRRPQHGRPLSIPQNARHTTRMALFFGYGISSAAQHLAPPRRRCGGAPRAALAFRATAVSLGLLLAPQIAYAQDGGGLASSPVSVVLLLAGLTLLPFLLVMTTSFIKFSVVLSILRSAIGTPQVPPTIVITGLAVVLTGYVMAPTGAEIYEALKKDGKLKGGSAQLLSGRSASELFAAAVAAREPVRRFLLKHSSPRDRALMLRLTKRLWPAPQAKLVSQRHLLVLVPAFVIGQLAAAFKIGFLIFVPFLIIDMVVANVLLALGMHMLSPTTVSLPFKLLLFVLVDGWALLTQGLVLSYA